MTYKGDKIIGKPSLALIEIFIAEKGLFCDPQECFDYWERKCWLTQKGLEPKTLESAIISYNSIAVQKFVKRNQKLLGISKMNKKDKKKAKRAVRKELLAGNKGLDNLIKLETFSLKTNIKTKKDNAYIPYDEQLNDKRWEAFRKFVFVVRGKVCEHCGATTNLQVHHPKYIHGRLAWEYNCNEVMVLCRDCHRKIHNIKL